MRNNMDSGNLPVLSYFVQFGLQSVTELLTQQLCEAILRNYWFYKLWINHLSHLACRCLNVVILRLLLVCFSEWSVRVRGHGWEDTHFPPFLCLTMAVKSIFFRLFLVVLTVSNEETAPFLFAGLCNKPHAAAAMPLPLPPLTSLLSCLPLSASSCWLCAVWIVSIRVPSSPRAKLNWGCHPAGGRAVAVTDWCWSGRSVTLCCPLTLLPFLLPPFHPQPLRAGLLHRQHGCSGAASFAPFSGSLLTGLADHKVDRSCEAREPGWRLHATEGDERWGRMSGSGSRQRWKKKQKHSAGTSVTDRLKCPGTESMSPSIKNLDCVSPMLCHCKVACTNSTISLMFGCKVGGRK